MKFLLATTNRDKIREYRVLFKASGLKLVTFPKQLKQLNVFETGKTYKANAVIKAKAYGRKFKLPTLADDTGLEIKALNNRPGIYSNRFAGGNFPKARKRILKMMNILIRPRH